MNRDSKIYIAGHSGLAGSSFVRQLKRKGYTNLLCRTHQELELRDQRAVRDFFEKERPEYVFLAAAKVGGIAANNTYRAEFIYDNLMIQNNIIDSSYRVGVKKLLFLGSICIYPRETAQPIKEDYLLTDPLEFTNEPYAIAKIAGAKLCENYNLQYGTNFVVALPTNLYGIHDNFDLDKSHVLPALMRKIHLSKLLQEKRYDDLLRDLGLETKQQATEYLTDRGVSEDSVEIWGDGETRRDLLYSDDMGDACVFIMEKLDFADLRGGVAAGGSGGVAADLRGGVAAGGTANTTSGGNAENAEVRNTHVNVGTGIDYSIREITEILRKELAYTGDFVFNPNKIGGARRRLIDTQRLAKLGWKAQTSLLDGIAKVYQWYTKAHDTQVS